MAREMYSREQYSTLGCEVSVAQKRQFVRLCASEGTTPSKTLRSLVSAYIASQLALKGLKSDSEKASEEVSA